MKIYKGIAVSEGIVIHKAIILMQTDEILDSSISPTIQNAESEFKRVEASVEKAHAQLDELRRHVAFRYGNMASSYICPIALEDEGFLESVRRMIYLDNLSAEHAVSRYLKGLRISVENSSDPYGKHSIAVEVAFFEKIILGYLLGKDTLESNHFSGRIFVGRDLSGHQLLLLDKQRMLGLATDVGHQNGHTAILARSLGIPAVFRCEQIHLEVNNGDLLIIDGYQGVCIAQPDKATIHQYRQLKNALALQSQPKSSSSSATKSEKLAELERNGNLSDEEKETLITLQRQQIEQKISEKAENQNSRGLVFNNYGTVQGAIGNVSNSPATFYDYKTINQLFTDKNIPRHDRRELEDILDEMKDAHPPKRKSLVARAEELVLKHKEALGAAAEIIIKSLKAAME